MATSSKMADLMSIIAHSPTATPAEKQASDKAAKAPVSVKKAKAAPQPTALAAPGKFSSIYLNPEDQKILRELSVWFAGQGLKINDTLIIRSALRSVRTGRELLAAYEEATLADRRKKPKE